MTLKNKTHDIERAAVVQRSPQGIVGRESTSEQISRPAEFLERLIAKGPQTIGPANILSLQRTIGNRAVQRMLNRRLDQQSPQSSLSANALPLKTREEEALVRKFETAPAADKTLTENRMRLPGNLRAGIENLSGLAMNDVRVHLNSAKPRELGALAYTEGSDIHIAPGQEQHLPHEAWHVVQQKQGRVKPTLQAKGLPINDDDGLEREADVMGARARDSAAGVTTSESTVFSNQRHTLQEVHPRTTQTKPVVQRKNLRQAGLSTGLTQDPDKLLLVDDPRSVYQYSEKATESANRLEALNKAGQMNAVIGKRKGNWPWTRKKNMLDNNNRNSTTLDPFLYRVEMPYKAGTDKRTLGLSFQHAAKFAGYIVWITDTLTSSGANWAEMYKSGGTKRTASKFSNIHDQTDASKLIDLTSGTDEKNLDAYTKIAGEGARWKCVRSHAAKLQNDSIFFTPQTTSSGEKKGYGVTFNNLWSTWSPTFKKKYDIEDSEVIQKLRDNQMLKKSSNARIVLSDITDTNQVKEKDYKLQP